MWTPDTATPVFVIVLPRTIMTATNKKRDVEIRRTPKLYTVRIRILPSWGCGTFIVLVVATMYCRTRSTNDPHEKLRAHGYGGGTVAGPVPFHASNRNSAASNFRHGSPNPNNRNHRCSPWCAPTNDGRPRHTGCNGRSGPRRRQPLLGNASCVYDSGRAIGSNRIKSNQIGFYNLE